MKFSPRQLVPLDSYGKPFDLNHLLDKKIAYEARSFQWQDSPVRSYLVRLLENNKDKVERAFDEIEVLANKADCERRRMGCVIWDLHLESIRAGGFNGKPKGIEGKCSIVGCIPSLTCRLTLHAEQTALLSVDPAMDNTGHILFNTAAPCIDCLKLCIARRVKMVVYKEEREQPEYDRPIMASVTRFGGITFVKVED
jgi:dCMP deaminase